ncbi:ribosomal protein S18-alanine N-acetyltransferase [Alteromonas sp. ASW11-130]|uniref:ribosomal protein S18-alanine N-acetyltransferase n=1 Tax=Alteromonas sp. ASW11-130 TaxID=3015775 RepID=UPI002241F2C1|nr:ribosomal protein S18-alanine N-acetyltransferase [Alteromonas sp. ASW11-130]
MKTDQPITRTTAQEDIIAAHAIHKAAVINCWSYPTFSDCTTKPYTLLVSKVNDRVIGYAIILIVADEATLMDIALSSEVRGHGHGKALLRAVIDYCETENVSSIWLEVRASNSIAQKLYHSFSFHTVEIRKNYYSTGESKEDAVIMQRIYSNT